MPIELDIDEEFVDAMNGANEKDLVDLAGNFVFFPSRTLQKSIYRYSAIFVSGILGMHSFINQVQYYNAVKGVPQDATFSGISFIFINILLIFNEKIFPEKSRYSEKHCPQTGA